jgi:hypothetical protein
VSHEVELVPETLAELGTRHDLLLLTKGDPVEQGLVPSSTLDDRQLAVLGHPPGP